MLTGREALPSDQNALDLFECSAGMGRWAADVEEWIPDLLEWQAEVSGRHVRLYEDHRGLVAIAAWRHLRDGDPGTGFFLYLVAVRSGCHREGIAKAIINGLIKHLAAQEPGAVLVWIVDPKNLQSNAMSRDYAEDEPRSDPEWPHFLEYSATLPE